MSTATKTYRCKYCRNPFTARIADRNRGWARFCSKSCKASSQIQGTPRNFKCRPSSGGDDEDQSWDAHKTA